MSTIMKAMDSVSGAMATAYVTIDDTRYNLMQLYSFEASMKINTSEVSILGKTGKGSKPAGWTGTWKGTAHYNQSVLRKLWLTYKNDGILTTMDIQVTNEDPVSSAGRQTVILKNCVSSGGIITKFDADSQSLTETIEGTFDDWEMPETFSLISGMI